MYDVAWATVRIGDLSEPTLVVFGDPDSVPLLGVVTLEEFGLGVVTLEILGLVFDPFRRTLQPMRALLV